MKAATTKATIGVLAALIITVSVSSLYQVIHPNAFSFYAEDRENAAWLASSKSWLDRKICRWLWVCGASHFRWTGVRFGQHIHRDSHNETIDWDWDDAWHTDSQSGHRNGTFSNLRSREIPDYVLEHAPLVHLFSGEQFWPTDIAEHLYHTSPSLNYTQMQSTDQHRNLTDLDELNRWQGGRWVFLTSTDDPEERPEWMEGEKNIPIVPSHLVDRFDDNDGWIHDPGRGSYEGSQDSLHDFLGWYGGGDHSWDTDDAVMQSMTGGDVPPASDPEQEFYKELKRKKRETRQRAPLRGGRSDAPATLVVVDKGDGIVDAFWFFFYSFNLGNVVLSIRFGNHVGDWEHTAVRFHHGKPKAVFFSEHNFGSAYSYEAVEKYGKRPVIYSAIGTHAMYATPGLHPYVLPWGILHDETDRGPLWDPVLNVHSYTYNATNYRLHASNLNPNVPTEWFHYAGHWGDKFYPLGDQRQYRFAGQYHYVNGPIGPKFKRLGRKKICGGPDSAPCVIKNWLASSNSVKKLQLTGEEADSFSSTARLWATEGIEIE